MEQKEQRKAEWLDEECGRCGRQLNSWDKRISNVLKYKYSCCEECIAKEYDMAVDALRNRMEHYLGMRPCLGL